ncbi:hypothetical protein [[Mycoplasma] anseris]|uniref:Uncharacterized protein n=1 Tax=[Mycoplasma] anseris TaxID=92400 RepID=A0A2Z4NCP4_9BACT|nr:hypothetical protein [[Mycoplasma] anseris]AWX69338.1 hypothetical protein DP065_01030 [[Mycoplasma] anseris]
MKKILNAQKQKDTRTLKYDPENDSVSTLITEFQIYHKNAHFIKPIDEMKIFEYFKEIRFMKIMDENLKDKIEETAKRQRLFKAKYTPYMEYEKWSDSPLAEKAKPLSKTKRIIIISVVTVVFIAMLLIIVGLNKWW